MFYSESTNNPGHRLPYKHPDAMLHRQVVDLPLQIRNPVVQLLSTFPVSIGLAFSVLPAPFDQPFLGTERDDPFSEGCATS